MNIFFPPYQGYAFILMTVVGLIQGVVYDIFKIKRKLFGFSSIVLFFDDFIFMLLSSIIFIFGVFALNNGILRWYEAAFCLIGFMLYRMTVSKLVISLSEAIINIIHRIVLMLVNAVLFPIKPLFNFIYRRLVCFFKKVLINKWIYKITPNRK